MTPNESEESKTPAEHLAVMTDPASDRERVAAAAVAIAESGDRDALIQLAWHLRSGEFLARLDDVDRPQFRIANFREVFEALAQHPNETSGRLCEIVAREQPYQEMPVRLNYVLPALLAVRPLTEEGAAIVRETNANDYYGLNGPLVLRNGSPLALRVFEEMVRDTEVPDDSRVAMIRSAVLPLRGGAGIVGFCGQLLLAGLEPAMETAFVEALFDHKVKEWFGVARHPPVPPAWSDVPSEVRTRLVWLGRTVLKARRVPEELLAAVEATLMELETLANA